MTNSLPYTNNVPLKKSERGFGLLESAIVMTVIAVLSAGVIAYGGAMQVKSKANATYAEVMQISENMDRVFSGALVYPDLETMFLSDL